MTHVLTQPRHNIWDYVDEANFIWVSWVEIHETKAAFYMTSKIRESRYAR